MNDAILVTYKASKAYRDGEKEVVAVDGVDVAIRRGSSTVILGPSGAGKSTLLHMLGCLDNPTSGSVLLDGLEIYKFSDKERARIRNKRIGFIFQFYHLLPEFTALENVMMPAMIMGGGAFGGIRQRAKDILKSVGLEQRMGHRPGELSGGESQRVAIARALINEPEALLCDEPTGNLDSKTSESIYELLFDLKSRSNTALVIVTHDERISARTDSVIRLKDGRIV
jgi:lipoprotein-releasing system ATP-binding protein